MNLARAARRKLPLLVLANAVGAAPGVAGAAGFRLPDMSIAGMGAANAMVANWTEVGAMPYNPAAMAFHRGITVTGGGVVFWSYMEVTNAAGTSGIDVSRPSSPPAPAFYISTELPWFGGNWHAGLAWNAPFGQETNWRAGSFPGFAAIGAAAAEPARSRIEMFNLNPNVSYRVPRIGDLELSIAAGLMYYDVRKAQLDTQAVGLSGDGTGQGWNVAAMAKLRNSWGLGVSHRSSVGVNINGNVTVPAAGVSGAATTGVRFPSITQAGVMYKPNDKLSLELDLEYTRWSTFERIVVQHNNPLVPSPIVNTNDWGNSWTFRFGATYQADQRLTLRGGYTYDRSPMNPVHFNARLPDNDRNIFHAGASYKVRDAAFLPLTLDLGYSYTRFNSRSYTGAPPGTFGADLNGTAVYNGTYKSHVHALGAGLTTRF